MQTMDKTSRDRSRADPQDVSFVLSIVCTNRPSPPSTTNTNTNTNTKNEKEKATQNKRQSPQVLITIKFKNEKITLLTYIY